MRKYTYVVAILTLFCMSCISNDVPYPYIVCEIQELEVEGQVGEIKIDPTKRTVELTIDEQAELDSVIITKLVANPEAIITPNKDACRNAKMFPDFSFASLGDLPANANTAIDFTKPVKILLQSYQDYSWTVNIKQVIERTISVENQVGTPIIDELNKIAVVYVAENQDLTKVKILELNLEGINSYLLEDPIGKESNFSSPKKYAVYRKNKHNEKGKYIGLWTLDVIWTKETSTTGDAEVWAKKAIVNGGMIVGATPSVEYKKSTASTWTKLDASAITITSATAFKATIKGLDDGTAYQWRVVVNGTAGDPVSFTTEKIQEVPNLNFDTWTQDGKNWFANAVAFDNEQPGAYWATGNTGVTSGLAGGKDPITIPVEGSDAHKGKAARLRSITGVTLVGAAAGNLFVGKYKTNPTKPSASVTFGRPFTGARPTKLTGYYKYTPEAINNGGKIPGNLSADQGHIYIKLWDSSGYEFAYGEFVATEKVNGYTKFSIDVNYKNLTARPAMITIVATSSRYGGEFEGAKVVGQVGHGSTLWVDEFELVYE